MRPVAIANRHPRLRFRPSGVARAIRVLDTHHDRLATPASVLDNQAELSVVFVTDGELARLHDEFLADPTITDVITFEGNAAFGAAGEICVSADAAARQVGRGARDSLAYARELTLYLVHGWLHLAGYDDLQPAKKRAMRRAEARAMKILAAEGALPAFHLQPASGGKKKQRERTR